MNLPPSMPPIEGSCVLGSVMASATAAKMESIANAISASSTLRTVAQNPDCFFSPSTLSSFLFLNANFLTIWLMLINNKYSAPMA
ncbi:hypothetical protein D1872_253730 [compost metagenome]